MGRWINIDDERNCYLDMEDEYDQYNIDPDVLSKSISIKTGKRLARKRKNQVLPDVRKEINTWMK